MNFGVASLRKAGERKRDLCIVLSKCFFQFLGYFYSKSAKLNWALGETRTVNTCKVKQLHFPRLCFLINIVTSWVASWTDTAHCCSWTQVILANTEVWKEEVKYGGVPLCSEMPSQCTDVIAITHAWKYACYLSNGWSNIKFEGSRFPGINDGFHRNGILLVFKSMVKKMFKCT